MGEMDEAVKMLEKAKSLDSEERAIQVELEKAIQKRKVSHDKERQLYQRMLAGDKPAKTKKNVAKSSLDSTWVSGAWLYLIIMSGSSPLKCIGTSMHHSYAIAFNILLSSFNNHYHFGEPEQDKTLYN